MNSAHPPGGRSPDGSDGVRALISPGLDDVRIEIGSELRVDGGSLIGLPSDLAHRWFVFPEQSLESCRKLPFCLSHGIGRKVFVQRLPESRGVLGRQRLGSGNAGQPLRAADSGSVDGHELVSGFRRGHLAFRPASLGRCRQVDICGLERL